MRLYITIALLICGNLNPCFADGKIYIHRDEVPASIPYQRALITYRDGIQTLFLQSKYQTVLDADKEIKIGWVVPIPTEPEIASASADLAQHLYLRLNLAAQPEVHYIFPYFILILLLLACGYLVYDFFQFIASFFSESIKEKRKGKKPLRSASVTILVILFFAGLLFPAVGGTLGTKGVEIVDAQDVGIYHVKVIKSDNSDSLIDWLNDGGFKYGDDDKIAFDEYIEKDWCFVVAEVKPETEWNAIRGVAEGLFSPLILRFTHEAPIYPLALTATGNHDTEILIYLASDSFYSCNDRLKLRHAEKHDDYTYWLDSLLHDKSLEPEGFFTEENIHFSHLSKFKGILNSMEMREDLVFTRKDSQKPFKETVVKLW